MYLPNGTKLYSWINRILFSCTHDTNFCLIRCVAAPIKIFFFTTKEILLPATELSQIICIMVAGEKVNKDPSTKKNNQGRV